MVLSGSLSRFENDSYWQGLPSPAEILHGRNLTTKAQAEIDINAIRSVLQERQLRMMLAHDLSRRAKKARPLVVGERCHVPRTK